MNINAANLIDHVFLLYIINAFLLQLAFRAFEYKVALVSSYKRLLSQSLSHTSRILRHVMNINPLPDNPEI